MVDGYSSSPPSLALISYIHIHTYTQRHQATSLHQQQLESISIMFGGWAKPKEPVKPRIDLSKVCMFINKSSFPPAHHYSQIYGPPSKTSRMLMQALIFVLVHTQTYTHEYVSIYIHTLYSQPRWDQSTFEGRARHFFTTTNPLNVLASDEELDKAKELLDQYK